MDASNVVGVYIYVVRNYSQLRFTDEGTDVK